MIEIYSKEFSNKELQAAGRLKELSRLINGKRLIETPG